MAQHFGNEGSEEYQMSFASIAIACLVSLALIFSRLRARKASKTEITKLFE